MSITVIGTVYVDFKGFPDGIYIPAGRNAGQLQITHGGVGHNVAEDITNAGDNSLFISLVEDSAVGREVIKCLDSVGVNTDYVLPTANGMGKWLAIFNESGDIVGSISQRPDLSPLLSVLNEKGDEIFSRSTCIVLEMDIDIEIVKKALELAQKHNKPVYGLVANMTIAADRGEYLKKLDCFVCNEQEAGIFFNTQEEITAETLSALVKKAGISSMVVTLGSQGAVYADISGEAGFYPAIKVCVKDTTGAGDAFCAGLSIGLSHNMSLHEAVAIGTQLASKVICVSESVCPPNCFKL